MHPLVKFWARFSIVLSLVDSTPNFIPISATSRPCMARILKVDPEDRNTGVFPASIPTVIKSYVVHIIQVKVRVK